MINFQDITYLKSGNQTQKLAFNTLKQHGILDKLNKYNPILTGTIPINIDIPQSDLDIICHFTNKIEFMEEVERLFSSEKKFQLRTSVINHKETVIANFSIDNFKIELFGQNVPTTLQNAYQHLVIEYQILQDKGEDFRKKIVNLKLKGHKTEPAFAKILRLKGDPYLALLAYKMDIR